MGLRLASVPLGLVDEIDATGDRSEVKLHDAGVMGEQKMAARSVSKTRDDARTNRGMCRKDSIQRGKGAIMRPAMQVEVKVVAMEEERVVVRFGATGGGG